MKIVKLKAENIKKLVAVEIAPTGAVVKITGKNGSGKTSVLDSLFWALAGADNIQDEPIRKGEKRAFAEVDLGDMIVRRTFTENGTTALTVENKDGLRFKTPQTMLDQLLGRLSFDPLDFMRQEPKKQFDTLRELTGVDFTMLDGRRQKLYDERTLANREAAVLKAQVGAVVVPAEPEYADEKEIDVTGLAGDLGLAMSQKNERDQAVLILNEAGRAEQVANNVHGQALDVLRSLQDQVERQKEICRDSLALVDTRSKQKTEAEDVLVSITVPDIAALQSQLKSAEETNRTIREKVQAYYRQRQAFETASHSKDVLGKSLVTSTKRADDLTKQIEAIDAEKDRLISSAKFPLDGLSFGDGRVVYAGLPLEQASAAEQLRISMGMAMAMNPKLRVLRITDGSLLDSTSMAVVEEMAKEKDFQIWIEAVDESGKVGIYIEEGKVAAVNE